MFFKCFKVVFSFKKQTIQFSFMRNLNFQQKTASNRQFFTNWWKALLKCMMSQNRNSSYFSTLYFQKQPSMGVLTKRFCENMRQIYRRTPMPMCADALQLYWNEASASAFTYKIAAYFQNTFSYEHLWRAASEISTLYRLNRIYGYA